MRNQPSKPPIVIPDLNTVITPLFEAARDSVQAGLGEGPLKGAAYLLKDLNTWLPEP